MIYTDIYAFCPECEEESLYVEVTNAGSGFNGEYEQHWYEGEGYCENCGFCGPVSDSD
jgi:hypothetical protein